MSDNQNPPKDQILLRHHLIIQNILNNISLAIRNNEKIKFSIEGLVIKDDVIRIRNITFDNTGNLDVESY